MTQGKPITRVLIYGGKTGWIGGMMADLIRKNGESRVHAVEFSRNSVGCSSRRAADKTLLMYSILFLLEVVIRRQRQC